MISFPDRLRLARVDIQTDAFFRAKCPTCNATKLYLQDDASRVECRGCDAVFTDGSLVLPSARQAHCHVCHLVCASNVEGGVKRCIPCQVAYEKTGGKDEVVRPLSVITYRLRFRDLLHDLPEPKDLHAAMARGQHGALPQA